MLDSPQKADRPHQATMQTILIAGSTGYAGRYLVQEYASQPDYKVKALTRRLPTLPFPANVEVVLGEVTSPENLEGILHGVDIVVSAVGITRQQDGITYQQVDYQANLNLLCEAEKEGIKRFGYVHVIHGSVLAKSVVAVAAKQSFVDCLQKSIIPSTVICPTGFFSDMQDFLDMAERGRVYLFGGGAFRLNPIHGEDLAVAIANAIEGEIDELAVGGPDLFSHEDLALMALEVCGKQVRITHIWDSIRRLIKYVLPWVTPLSTYGPAQFFLEVMGMDMVGEQTGKHHLKAYWTEYMLSARQTTSVLVT